MLVAVPALGSTDPAPASDLRWTLVGARPVQPRPEGERLVYPEVYPGITLTLESHRQSLTYRFDLAPGADPAAIRLRYAGAEDIVVDHDGRALRIRAGGQDFRESGLTCFEEGPDLRHRVAVACHYAVTAPGARAGPRVGPRAGPEACVRFGCRRSSRCCSRCRGFCPRWAVSS